MDRVAFAGALHDPVAAALLCAPQQADWVMVNGSIVVEDGHLTNIDLPRVLEAHNKIAADMFVA